MNTKFYIFGSLVLVLTFLLIIINPFSAKEKNTIAPNQPTPTPSINTSLPSGAETIEILHFHATQQCWSCTTVGKYALETIKNKFSGEFESGKIVFKDINGELIENRELVNKFKAGSSSLFINVIKDGQDHIEEDVTVWRLVNNQDQFITYFESKLKKLL